MQFICTTIQRPFYFVAPRSIGGEYEELDGKSVEIEYFIFLIFKIQEIIIYPEIFFAASIEISTKVIKHIYWLIFTHSKSIVNILALTIDVFW